jgi:hypothetical protein
MRNMKITNIISIIVIMFSITFCIENLVKNTSNKGQLVGCITCTGMILK